MVTDKKEDIKSEDEYILAQIEKMVYKITEIQSMMKNGEFIVAYEKIGGVLKNLMTSGGVLQARLQHHKYV